jgi:hypothetical protein
MLLLLLLPAWLAHVNLCSVQSSIRSHHSSQPAIQCQLTLSNCHTMLLPPAIHPLLLLLLPAAAVQAVLSSQTDRIRLPP